MMLAAPACSPLRSLHWSPNDAAIAYPALCGVVCVCVCVCRCVCVFV